MTALLVCNAVHAEEGGIMWQHTLVMGQQSVLSSVLSGAWGWGARAQGMKRLQRPQLYFVHQQACCSCCLTACSTSLTCCLLRCQCE